MYIKNLKIAEGVILALAAFSSEAAQQFIQCPQSIVAKSVQLVDTEQGWMPFVTAPLYLHAAAPIYGSPELHGEIADFISHPGKLEWSYTYKLEGNFDDGKWIQCAYGANNELTLSKRIDDDTKECTVTYRKGKKIAQHDIKILCK